jgi:hypothetical protein
MIYYLYLDYILIVGNNCYIIGMKKAKDAIQKHFVFYDNKIICGNWEKGVLLWLLII